MVNVIFFNLIHQFAGRSRFLDGVGFFIADSLTYFLVLAGAYFLWRLRGWRQRIFGAIEICLAVLLSRGIVTSAIRYFYHHLRPFAALNFAPLIVGETPDNSFPSGHMTALFAFATVVYCLNRKWGTWFLLASFLVGIGRIYAGIHWPFDILGGIVIGIASGWFVHWLVERHWWELESSAAEVAGTAL
jgi:undecaprenyl-diphosphatase